jgi:hypothetical protein
MGLGRTRKVAPLVVAALATTLLLGSTIVASGAGPVAQPHDTCAHISGSMRWTGNYQITSGGSQSRGTWSAMSTVAADGTLDGKFKTPIAPSILGFVGCNEVNWTSTSGTPTLTVVGDVFPDASSGGTESTGSGTFIYGNISGTWTARVTPGLQLSLTPSVLPTSLGPVSYTATVSSVGPAPSGVVSIADGTDDCSFAVSGNGPGSCTLDQQASLSPYTVEATYAGDPYYADVTTTIVNAAAIADGGTITIGNGNVQASATGGTSGVDTIQQTDYGDNPVGNLNNGLQYFDVVANTGNTFTTVVITNCVGVSASSILSWWDPTANAGAGGWVPVRGNPGPSYDSNIGCLSATLDDTTSPTIGELTGTVFGVSSNNAITSVGGASARVGQPFSFTVMTSGLPVPTLSKTGPLPAGLQFTPHPNGTATISGTPTGTGGIYRPSFAADFGAGGIVMQPFALFVYAQPKFTSPANLSVKMGKSASFVVRASGYNPASITAKGKLPKGMVFTNKSDGTALLTGKPAAGTGGTYPVSFTAKNLGGTRVQKFTVTVVGFHVATRSSPAGKRGAAYSSQLNAAGGTPPYTWKTLTSPPAGLTLSTTGVLSGTPKTTLQAKIYSFTVQVTDKLKKTATATISLKLS